MIFAILDYVSYRLRSGRYSDRQHDAAMGGFAFVDTIPANESDQFQEGDLIFTQRYKSFLSWAMMYITSSSVDHTGIYAGQGKIAHRTLRGGKLHDLRAFARNCRILVVRMSPTEMAEWSRRFELMRPRIDRGFKAMHLLPPKGQLALGGLMSIHGKYVDRFRWKLWAEFFMSVLLICYIAFYTSEYYMSFIPSMVSMFFLLYYGLLNLTARLRGRSLAIMSHPDLGYRIFFEVGGLMFTRIYPVAVSHFGLLPLKVVLSLAGQGPDNGSDDKLEEARQFFRHFVEGWNIEELTQEAKKDNRYKEENK